MGIACYAYGIVLTGNWMDNENRVSFVEQRFLARDTHEESEQVRRNRTRAVTYGVVDSTYNFHLAEHVRQAPTIHVQEHLLPRIQRQCRPLPIVRPKHN
jgi:hypothetical protein